MGIDKLSLSMKIKFFTEGGKKIGMGHLTRCLSLCQAFEEKGRECLFVVKGGDEVRQIVHKPMKLLDWVNNIDDFESELDNCDVVVIDSYSAEPKHYQLVCEKVKYRLFIDDFSRIEYPCGIVLNGSIYAKDINYPKKSGIIYLLGTEYTPLRKAFWDVEDKIIRDKVEKVLISFGGDDSKNMTPKVVKLLEENFPELEKLVVVGAGFVNKEEIYAFSSKGVKIYENLSAEEMKSLMLDADVAVSAGGQTTYELARIGVPSILVAVADNQLMNCKGWEKVGFAKYAGWWEDGKAFENLIYYLKNLQNFEIRYKMSNIGRSLVDGQGARMVANEII